MKSLERQEGGNHYKDMVIQPMEFIMENYTKEVVKGVIIKDVLKYITRDKDNEKQDWRKAKHYIEMYIEYLEELTDND